MNEEDLLYTQMALVDRIVVLSIVEDMNALMINNLAGYIMSHPEIFCASELRNLPVLFEGGNVRKLLDKFHNR